MATDTLILLGLGLVAALLAVLLLRRPEGAGAAALATLRAELAADSARHAAEAAASLAAHLSTTREALTERLHRQEGAQAGWLAEQREAGAAAREALIEALRREAAELRALLEATRGALAGALERESQARLAWAGEQREHGQRAQTALLETLAREVASLHALLERKGAEQRAEMERRLDQLRETSERRLDEIQRGVNEQLAGAVERQMNESFNRVIDQFTAIQQMMGSVQAVAAQVGDLKRLFGNVKARGGWGEGQVRALLDDILPPGAWETNVQVRPDSRDMVEFAIVMPAARGERVWLAVDAKFPTEDYERMLIAHEAGDAEGERAARAGLARRIREEAAKIASKYICPPSTAEFAVLYLPTDGLYAEVARLPGLIDEVGRAQRIMILGPSLLPGLLRTIQLGHVTLALSRNAEGVRELLAATRGEMVKMEGVLASLGKQVTTVSNTLGQARTRTRVIARRLRSLDEVPEGRAKALLGLDGPLEEDEEA